MTDSNLDKTILTRSETSQPLDSDDIFGIPAGNNDSVSCQKAVYRLRTHFGLSK